MYKVLALDLDGTVLNDHHQIHPEVKAEIIKAQQYCQVIIVTGRHHTAARPYYQELELTTPIICCNGTYVYDYANEKVLSHRAIEKQDALDFIKLAIDHQANMVMYVTNAMLYSKHNPIAYMQTLEDWALSLAQSIRPNIYKIDSFALEAEQTEYIWKFVVEANPESIEEMVLHPLVQAKFNGERSWSNRIDFAAKGNTKGERLAQYLATQGIDAKEAIAVGDNHNDISMIDFAGLGVAMANADTHVKSFANQICLTTSNENGLARLIKEKITG